MSRSTAPLGSFGSIADGPFGSKLKSVHYKPCGVRVVRLQNIGVGQFNDSDQAFISEEHAATMPNQRVLPGDVLVASLGEGRYPAGRACLYPTQLPPAVNKADCFRMRLDTSRLEPSYVVHLLNSPVVRKLMADASQGATRPRLNTKILGSFPVPLNSVEEQRRIVAGIESRLAAVVESADHIQDERAKVRSLVHQTLRQTFDSATRSVPLGQVLQETKKGIGVQWRDRTLYGASRTGLSPAKEGIGKEPERYKPVDAETIFYNPMRILLGSIAMLPNGERSGIASPDYVVFRCSPKVLDPVVFYSWFRSSEGERLILSLARGAVRERLLFPRLAEGMIPLPDYKEQMRARAVLDQAQQANIVCDLLQVQLDALAAAVLREAFA